MKRAKVMLLSIAVLATVGGALAFKAKKYGETKYCYLVAENQPSAGQCTSTIQNATAVARTTGSKLFYTVTSDLTKCNESTLNCPNVAQTPFDN